MVFYYLTTTLFIEVRLSFFCEIENLGCFLRITKEVSIWMIWILDLIGKHWSSSIEKSKYHKFYAHSWIILFFEWFFTKKEKKILWNSNSSLIVLLAILLDCCQKHEIAMSSTSWTWSISLSWRYIRWPCAWLADFRFHKLTLTSVSRFWSIG